MTTCLIILTIVHCSIAPGSKLTPAAAAQLLIPHQFVYIGPAPAPDCCATVTVGTWTMPTAENLRPTYPLQPPFFMRTYTGPSRSGRGRNDGETSRQR